MTSPTIHYSPNLDPNIEAEVRSKLIEHYGPIYKERVNGFIDNSLATEHFSGRFLYLKSVIGEDIFNPRSTILVSGFGMGSEMIMARQFGFGKIYGVEVEQFFVDVTTRRLCQFPDMYPVFYEGNILPFDDGQFMVVISGHVIEHTSDPKFYLTEVLRVAAPGGYLSLEFPHHYHTTELHTGLPSFEWLPKPLRNSALGLLSSKASFLREDIKLRYISIVSTNLQQVSMGGIKHMLNNISYSSSMMGCVHAAPGIIRCVICRN